MVETGSSPKHTVQPVSAPPCHLPVRIVRAVPASSRILSASCHVGLLPGKSSVGLQRAEAGAHVAAVSSRQVRARAPPAKARSGRVITHSLRTHGAQTPPCESRRVLGCTHARVDTGGACCTSRSARVEPPSTGSGPARVRLDGLPPTRGDVLPANRAPVLRTVDMEAPPAFARVNDFPWRRSDWRRRHLSWLHPVLRPKPDPWQADPPATSVR